MANRSNLVVKKGQRFGEYELEEPLGGGGEAEIWKAKHRVTQQVAAIRIFKERQEENADRRFKAEVSILRKLARHDHIIPLWSSSWNHGCPYLVMPYISAGSLANELKNSIVVGNGFHIQKLLSTLNI